MNKELVNVVVDYEEKHKEVTGKFAMVLCLDENAQGLHSMFMGVSDVDEMINLYLNTLEIIVGRPEVREAFKEHWSNIVKISEKIVNAE